MIIYLASRYDRLVEMNGYADRLRQAGHVISSRWLDGTHQLHPGIEHLSTGGFTEDSDGVPMAALPFGKDDVADIKASDTLVFFAERPESHSKRGGRHVEFGIALALGKRIMVVGPRENIFHCLPQIERYASFEKVVEAL